MKDLPIRTYQSLTKKTANGEETATVLGSLSGLAESYLPQEGDLDVETIWGQVDLQNEALRKLLKRSVKRLAKAPEDVCVLNMGEVLSEEEEDEDEESDNDQAEQVSDEEGGEESDADDDSETKRIRERMERAMDDMDS